MAKYVVKSTGKPVQVGDTLQKKIKKEYSFGSFESVEEILITELMIPILIADGIIEEVKNVNKVENKVPVDLNFYLNKISNRLAMNSNTVTMLLDNLNKAGYKKAVFDILLKEVASVINHKPGGFKIPEIKWYISMKDGKVYSTKDDKSAYVTYFYSAEDANLAVNILQDQLTFMFGKK